MTSGRFVGRTDTLRRLDGVLDAAIAGRGGFLLVRGEAGIGKTRLVDEFADRAQARGCVVATGHCIDLVGAGVPYLPIVELLRALPGNASRLLTAQAGTAPRDDGDGQLRLFESVRAAFEQFARAQPVAVVLEDLHWADESTLNLLAFLAHAVRDDRIAVVGTYRSDDPGADRLARLARAVPAADLAPLSRDDVDALLENLAGAMLPADLTEEIFRRSEGNPFFAEELLAAARRDEAHLPYAVRDALLQRVAALSDRSRGVVRVAAAAGRDVSYRLLAAVADLPEQRLLAALREAVDQQVLVPIQASGAYRFRHALLAEAVYGTLLPGEREAIHARLATALAADDRESDAGELAQHWAAADRPVEALTESLRAAQAAEAVSGWAEALRHLQRVLDLWPRVEDPERLGGTGLAAVLARAAEAAHLTGSGQRAAALVQRAIDEVGEANAAVLYERLGSYLLPTGDRDAGLNALRHAARLVPADPPSAERVRILAALGNALRLSMRHDEALSVCEEAISLAGHVGERSAAFRARDIFDLSRCFLGRLDDGLAGLREACETEQGRATPLDILCPYALRTDALIMAGRLPEAARVARDGLDLARQLGVERGVGTLLAANAAEALLGLGDWTAAESVLGGALRTGGEFWGHQLHRLRAQLAVGRGEFDAAHRHLAAGVEAAHEPPTMIWYACTQAELASWERRPEDALAAVERGFAADAGDVAFGHARLAALGLRVCESADLARSLVQRARASARRAAGLAPDTALWCAIAEAEYARIERGVRPQRWQVAAAAADDLGRPYVAAYCRWQQAAALHGTETPTADVTAAARAAFEGAVRLDAWPLRREVELLAQRARLDLVAPSARRPTDPSKSLGLTAREDEVLGLLARGFTNREIAAELTISVKTASVHVSHILQKLGTSNRTQAAAIAHRASHGE